MTRVTAAARRSGSVDGHRRRRRPGHPRHEPPIAPAAQQTLLARYRSPCPRSSRWRWKLLVTGDRFPSRALRSSWPVDLRCRWRTSDRSSTGVRSSCDEPCRSQLGKLPVCHRQLGRQLEGRIVDGVVEVRGGRVRGVQRHGSVVVLGNPLRRLAGRAAPLATAGAPRPWTGIRVCDRFGPIAPQSPGLVELSLGGRARRAVRGLPQPSTSGPRGSTAAAGRSWSGSTAAPSSPGRGRAVSTEAACWPGRATWWWSPSTTGSDCSGSWPTRRWRTPDQTWLDGRGVVGVRQLGPGRPGGRPPVGAGPHRRLRRRPGQRDPLRRVGRGDERLGPAGRPGGPGAVPPGHRRERSALHLHRRAGVGPGRAAGRPPRGAR